jgi:hypothetical protein
VLVPFKIPPPKDILFCEDDGLTFSPGASRSDFSGLHPKSTVQTSSQNSCLKNTNSPSNSTASVSCEGKHRSSPLTIPNPEIEGITKDSFISELMAVFYGETL